MVLPFKRETKLLISLDKPKNMGKSEVIGLFIEQGGNMNSAVDLLNTTKE